MKEIPSLRTPRLLLRPFNLFDAPQVEKYAVDADIGRFIPNFPHPYEMGEADFWISTHLERWRQGQDLILAVTRFDTTELLGAVELGLHPSSNTASLGFWIGKPHWNNGYATEAGRAMLRYGFQVQRLHKISGSHLGGNQASAKVIQKLGLICEGLRRQQVLHRGQYHDSVEYGLLRSEWSPELTFPVDPDLRLAV